MSIEYFNGLNRDCIIVDVIVVRTLYMREKFVFNTFVIFCASVYREH